MPFQVRPLREDSKVVLFLVVLFRALCRSQNATARVARARAFLLSLLVFACALKCCFVGRMHSHSETRAGRVDASEAGRRMVVEREEKKASSRVGRVSSEVGCEASARGGARNARRRRKKVNGALDR